MILLLGGESSTAEIARGLAGIGCRVLVSRATEIPLDTGGDDAIESRSGPLDEGGLVELIAARKILAVVDATHPYATTIRRTARRAAERMNIPYLSFLRPAAIDPQAADVQFAADHAAAAAAAFSLGRPVLLTTGTKNLAPYVEASRRTGLPLVVRALDWPQSLRACRLAGVAEERIVAGRGPFSLEENRRQIRAYGIGTLVTKDSGRAGGVPEKLAAARAEGCRVVVLRRPPADPAAFAEVEALIRAVRAAIADFRPAAD